MIRNGIIPSTPVYYNTETNQIVKEQDYLELNKELDLKAICTFAACGFFLDDDTHFIGVKALKPATEYQLNGDIITQKRKYFSWYNEPRNISLAEATKEFAEVFQQTVDRLSLNKEVILPLSGGLDSRSLAAALKHRNPVKAYSYEFEGGESETWYSKKIAKAESFSFTSYKIKKGYLWRKIDELGKLNNCTSEFTHPRQMAVIDDIEKLGNCFFLGHWGDVLFDGMGVADDLSFDEQVNVLYKKVLKKGGEQLGIVLWEFWKLDGDFSSYLKNRISSLLAEINIPNANSRIRAFKSMYWAPRWTSSNMSIFRRNSQIAVPYYDDAICEFICTIPEKLLNARQIQIEYLKIYAPELAKITWQGHGLDLYHYQNFHKWHNIPNRLVGKLKRTLAKQNNISRNWELQFLGEQNISSLNSYIYNDSFNQFVDKSIVKKCYKDFVKDGVYNSHPLSILLTLSTFHRLRNK